MPAQRALYDLAVNAAVLLQLAVIGPRLQVVEVGHKRERFFLVHQTEADDGTKMRDQDACRLLQGRHHPRILPGLFGRLALKWIPLRRLDGEAPAKINAPEPCRLVKESEAVFDKRLGDGVLVLLLAWNIEAGEDPRVLVQAGVLRDSTQGCSNKAHPAL